MFDFWIGFCTWCSWTWVMKIRQDNIDDSPLDSQARQTPLHLHSSLRKGKKRDWNVVARGRRSQSDDGCINSVSLFVEYS